MGKKSESGNNQTLTIYHLKNGFEDASEILMSDDPILSVSFLVADHQMMFYYLDPKINRPRWKSLFDTIEEIKKIDFLSACSSAVLIVRLNEASFAITFGQGRHLLRPGTWNERFGLIVTLNSVAKDSLRSIDKKSFAAFTKHVREQTVESVSSGDFGIDIEQDLLRAVVGTPSDSSLGTRMTGMDALPQRGRRSFRFQGLVRASTGSHRHVPEFAIISDTDILPSPPSTPFIKGRFRWAWAMT